MLSFPIIDSFTVQVCRTIATIASVAFLVGFSFTGCATAPKVIPPVATVGSPPPAPPPPLAAPPVNVAASPLIRLAAGEIPNFDDDGDIVSLRNAASQSAGYYRSLPAGMLFRVAQDTYSAQDFAISMESLVDLLDHSQTPGDWLVPLRREFIVYQSAGTGPEHQVTFSSYYEPTISARLTKSAEYRYPLYARPPDLIDVDLGLFIPAYQGARIAGRREGRTLVPYLTRKDIDNDKALEDQRLEIAWAKDPLDIFFLQVEGSGWLDVGGGQTVRIHYDGDNGRKYQSVGQYMIATHRVPAQGFGHDGLKRYMQQHPAERQSILNIDERYIFFKLDYSSAAIFAYGNINVPLTPGRSIATDPKLFAKGALAWVSVDGASAGLLDPGRMKPSQEGVPPGAHRSIHRFMLNQDEGGAIQGANRVDFFAGHGPAAEHFATHLWHSGKLYFLVKRPR